MRNAYGKSQVVNSQSPLPLPGAHEELHAQGGNQQNNGDGVQLPRMLEYPDPVDLTKQEREQADGNRNA